jgi:hypothetical protein
VHDRETKDSTATTSTDLHIEGNRYRSTAMWTVEIVRLVSCHMHLAWLTHRHHAW